MDKQTRLKKFSKWVIIVGFYLFGIQALVAQTGRLEGVITDKKTGETLVGVAITIDGTTTGTVTDLDGHYEITNIKAGVYNFKVAFISYQPYLANNIKIDAGKTVTLNVAMEESSLALESVTITAVRKNNTEMAVLNSIKENKILVSGISSQQIKKGQDRDASEVVKRISGVTIVDDRFIVVRGLNQRYNNVWLNNAATPSSESDIKAFSFDVIPSSMIDNIMVYKSSAPELPADFSGGFIKVYTKNLPSENSYSLSYSSSYSEGTTFKDFKHYNGGKKEWAGYDDGTRSLPSYFPSSLNQSGLNDRVELSKSLNNDWTRQQSMAVPDQRLAFNMAHRFNVGSTSIGEISTINYSRTRDYNRVMNRDYGVYNFAEDKPSVDFDFMDDVYLLKTRVSAMSNWSWVLNNQHKIEFHNLYSHEGKERTSVREGVDSNNQQIISNENGFMARTTFSTQLGGSHVLKEDDMKVDWVAGYAIAKRDEPDLRQAKQVLNDSENDANYGNYFLPISMKNDAASRLFIDMNEHIASFGANFENKFIVGAIKPLMKAGLYYESKNREFNARRFGYVYSNSFQKDVSIEYLPVDEVLSEQYMNTTTGIGLTELTSKPDSYDAANKNVAGYLGFNIPITSKLNIYAGARVEQNRQTLDSYDRFQQPVHLVIDTLNLFPSVNATYNFNEKNLVRVSYGKSVNRPEFRETAPFSFYAFEDNALYSGNDKLKNCYINSYDIRFESYPAEGETFSIGAFYKEFTNPIELKYAETGSGLEYSYQNAETAINYGVEIEVKKNLETLLPALRHLAFGANATLIQSTMKFKNSVTDLERPMAGQSPYVVNAGLYYNNDEKSGLSMSLLYHVMGKRIHIVGLPRNNSWENIPDIYEMARHQLDFTLNQKVGKHLELKAGIKDILNNAVTYQKTIDTDVDMAYYGGNQGVQHFKVDQVTKQYKPGSYYTLGLLWNF